MSEEVLKLSGSFEGRGGAFRLFNDRYLEVEIGRGKKARRYKLDLLSLASGKTTSLNMSVKWALLAALFLAPASWLLGPWKQDLLAGRIGPSAIQADLVASLEVLKGGIGSVNSLGTLKALAAQLGMLGPGAVLGLFGLVALVVFVLKLRPVTRFKALISGVPLVSVPRPVLGRGAVEAHRFVKLVHQRIAQARRVFKVDQASQQAGEVKLLRRLVELGVIDSRRYQAGKKKVFKEQG